MPKYRKLPVEIEAVAFTEESKDRAFSFVTCNKAAAHEDGVPVLKIQTLEGTMTASLGDFIIKGIAGEFYPCKPDIFAATYEAVDESVEVKYSIEIAIDAEQASRLSDPAGFDDVLGRVHQLFVDTLKKWRDKEAEAQ